MNHGQMTERNTAKWPNELQVVEEMLVIVSDLYYFRHQIKERYETIQT